MTRRLLSLAVTVQLEHGGKYFWQIIESFEHDSEWLPLTEGVSPFESYSDALLAGCDALRALCDDPLVGPMSDTPSGRPCCDIDDER